ncbi:MAG: ATP-dependent DNA helicase RecG [Pseudomonadota bacterium]
MRPEILNPLFEPVSSLSGIGPKLAKLLTKLFHGEDSASGAVLGDLLTHVPHSHIDRRNQPTISEAIAGEIATFRVYVDQHFPPPRSKPNLPYKIAVHDETGELDIVFFRGSGDWLAKSMPVGEVRYISGTPERFNNKFNMVHPDHMVSEEAFAALPLVEPVYPATAGLSPKVMAKAIRNAVDKLPILPEWTERTLQEREKWPDFETAIHRLHFPRDGLDLDPKSPARRRLAHDELFAGQLALALLRNQIRKTSGKARKGTRLLQDTLISAIPYTLTKAQQRTIQEISTDLEKPERMLRLLQGDVGSGKTIVALVSAVQAIEAGDQVALMAPTEILARQHLQSLKQLCDKIGIRIEVLTGKDKAAKRRETLAALETGAIDILIGTHALFQESVVFKTLGLVIIDEQHRFGVHQRLTLGEKGDATDILVMTATPIPRTLVLTAYGDMEISKLDEKPPGRQPIQTNSINAERIEELIERIRHAVTQGQKIYWICPLVEESEELDVMSATDRHEDLTSRLGNFVGLIHGRMDANQKQQAMEDFKTGATRVLVATTVIEVGIDVPDANIIVIEHAERFGLAQLHQLRGRVGRGSQKSSCILLYYPHLSETAHARLRIMRESEDGFLIAEEDLRLRGEGEVLGTRQSGLPGFQLASMEHHADILEIARNSAKLALINNPALSGQEGEALRVLLYLFGKDRAVRMLRAG